MILLDMLTICLGFVIDNVELGWAGIQVKQEACNEEWIYNDWIRVGTSHKVTVRRSKLKEEYRLSNQT